ncbi:unnamed protein product [Merluccius merluccius]
MFCEWCLGHLIILRNKSVVNIFCSRQRPHDTVFEGQFGNKSGIFQNLQLQLGRPAVETDPPIVIELGSPDY